MISLSTILFILLIIFLIGAVPAWPYSRAWGYQPVGIIGIVLLIFLLLILSGRVVVF